MFAACLVMISFSFYLKSKEYFKLYSTVVRCAEIRKFPTELDCSSLEPTNSCR